MFFVIKKYFMLTKAAFIWFKKNSKTCNIVTIIKMNVQLFFITVYFKLSIKGFYFNIL